MKNEKTAVGRFFERVAEAAGIVPAIAVMAVLTVMLALMALPRAGALVSGTEVLLETLPRDPRSILSGDYVVLNYKISSLSPEHFTRGGSGIVPSNGSKVFVSLVRSPSGYCLSAVSGRIGAAFHEQQYDAVNNKEDGHKTRPYSREWYGVSGYSCSLSVRGILPDTGCSQRQGMQSVSG